MERSPPTRKSSFEFVLVPCVRARRSCVGEREELLPPSLEGFGHKCLPPGVVARVPAGGPLVSRRWPAGVPWCPVGVPSVARGVPPVSRGVPSVYRRCPVGVPWCLVVRSIVISIVRIHE